MNPGALPLIGITADLSKPGARSGQSRSEATIFLPERYTRIIEQCGGVPLILPSSASKAALKRYLDTIDGLVISGGNFDIHPRYYGEKAIKALGNLIPERTEFELDSAELALARDLPLLGICGGMQAINVVQGGSLFQDIASQCPAAGEHQQSAKKMSGGHRVEVKDGTQLRKIVRRRRVEVNTTHHQAVKIVGRGLIVNAVAGDGIIEGIEYPARSFVLGVQWHPEILARRQPAQRRLFSTFVGHCRNFRRRAGC